MTCLLLDQFLRNTSLKHGCCAIGSKAMVGIVGNNASFSTRFFKHHFSRFFSTGIALNHGLVGSSGTFDSGVR